MDEGANVFILLVLVVVAVYWLWPEDPRIGTVRVYYNDPGDDPGAPREPSEPRLNQAPPAYRAELHRAK